MQKLASFTLVSTLLFSHATANRYHEKIVHDNLPGLKALCRLQRSGINAKARYGETPLHMAVVKNKQDMVELLLAYGAPILTTNDFGQTPIHSAAKLNYIDILTLLLNCLKTTECADWQKTILDWQDNDGNTALHLAAAQGNNICVRKLVRADADMTIKNNVGHTATNVAQYASDTCYGNDSKKRLLRHIHQFLQDKIHESTVLIGNRFAVLAELDGLAIA